MRTLADIVDDAKAGNIPTHEECYWAMLAQSAVLSMHARDLLKLCTPDDPPSNARRQMTGKLAFDRYKSALNADPKTWLGPNHDPANPEVQRFRKTAFRIFERVTGEKIDE
jgi:hypothetical protein